MSTLDEMQREAAASPGFSAGEPERAAYSQPGRPVRGANWQGANQYAVGPQGKSSALATILSLMPGLGHVYVGYYQQGFINIMVAASLITLLASKSLGRMTPFFGLFLAFFWLYNMIDAWRRACFYNQALVGAENLDLPDSMKMAPGRAGLVSGVVLIILGVLAFAHTMFDYSLEWLAEWWPIALVIIGGYLIAQAVLDRQKK
jgi:hypothetical protein